MKEIFQVRIGSLGMSLGDNKVKTQSRRFDSVQILLKISAIVFRKRKFPSLFPEFPE